MDKYIDPKTFEVNTDGKGKKISPFIEGGWEQYPNWGEYSEYRRWVSDEVPNNQLCWKCKHPGDGTVFKHNQNTNRGVKVCPDCHGSGLLATWDKE